MLVKTPAIFLHSIKYSDSSIIAHVYTRSFGCKSYIASGVHGKRSHTKSNLFQPLFLLNLEVYHKPNSASLQRMKSAQMATPLASLPFEISKSAQALFIGELLSKVLHEEEPSEDFFDFLFTAITLLDATNEKVSNFLLVFLFKLTRYLGIAPQGKRQERDCYFDLMQANFVEKEPMHPHFLDVKASQDFASLFSAELTQLHRLSFSNSVRRTLFDALIFYYKVHLEIKTDFKSLAIIREVLEG